ncbi:hypothetical protein [Roseimaritima ulvae]|uniref:Uncharacterized protein n=1 Tax=Roseimaritima ulvae TaxID=980254 RepID=A0A5B9QWW6_9BACT|nr:hypothetical protein [Roseimaritima ulvae]QEG42290.1 hypothetical protein UC8_43240 [Roseimaritima ulvae]
MWNRLACGLAALCLTLPQLAAQDAPATDAPAIAPTAAPADGAGETPAQRDARFAEYMTGAKFIGRFTIVGKDNDNMPEEEYTIHKCEKLDKDDLFRFTARIRYGDTDTELPMDLPVKWAGRTPVITLEKMWLPGLGTFSSRVVIHSGRYAGTWDHGDKGGHLFGRIVPATAAEPAPQRQP